MFSQRWTHRLVLGAAMLAATIALPQPPACGAEIVPVSVAADLGDRQGDRRLATNDSGRFLVFESLQPNLIPGQIDPMDVGRDRFGYECDYLGHPYLCTMGGDYDVYLHDRVTDETLLVSHVEGEPSRARPLPSKSYWVSSDGSGVLYANFRQQAPGSFSFFEDLTLYDRDTHSASKIASVRGDRGFEVRTSADGTIVVLSGILDFEDQPPPFMDDNGAPDLYLYDQRTETLALISAAAGMPTTTGDRGSPRPVTAWASTRPRSFDMDAAGARVVFGSDATNLVDNDNNGIDTDIFLYGTASQSLSLVSRSIGGGTADRDSRAPSISGDGSRIVFQSFASDLVPDFIDGNGPNRSDIYLYEPGTETMVLVSRSRFAPNLGGAGESFDPVISEDGSTIVFASKSSDLYLGFVDGNGDGTDIFRYDVATRAVSLASRSRVSVNQGADGESRRPRLDNDGGRMLFESQASDLVLGFVDGNEPDEHDLFAFTTATATVTLVNRAAGSVATSANQGAEEPRLNQAGTTVLYSSEATDLITPMAATPGPSFYAFDLAIATTTPGVTSASLYADASSTGDSRSFDSDIDGAGRFVTFRSGSNNLVVGQVDPIGNSASVFLYDRETGENTLVSRAAGSATTEVSATRARISADGNYVAFISFSDGLVTGLVDNNDEGDVFLFERATGIVQLVSRAAGDPSSTANGASSDFPTRASLSGDGRFVAFLSKATDLTPGFVDNNTGDDLFLFDRMDGSNTLLSASSTAPLESANARTRSADVTSSGQYVVFRTRATDVVPGFINPLPSTTQPVDNLVLWDRMRNEYSLVSHAFSNPMTGADDGAFFIAMTHDAERVLLGSNAQNLVEGFVDSNGSNGSDLYYWEQASNTVHLASRSTAGPTTGVNATIGRATISDDGAWIAFDTDATDLIDGFVPGNTSGTNGHDVFLFEVATGTTTLVSRSSRDPLLGADGLSWAGAVAEDAGRHYVYFSSGATDLIDGLPVPPGQSQFGFDVYRYDIAAGTTELLTHAVGSPFERGNLTSGLVAASTQGGYAIVSSNASNLVSRDHNSEGDIFLIGDGLAADLAVRKTDSIDPVPAGALFDYTIAVENVGLAPATAVGVFDALPDGLEVVGVPSGPWRCFGNDFAVGCLLRQALAPGATAPPLDITVRAPLTGGTITNTATATSAVPEVAPGTNTDFETTTVIEGRLLFADGFESGDTSAWSNTLP